MKLINWHRPPPRERLLIFSASFVTNSNPPAAWNEFAGNESVSKCDRGRIKIMQRSRFQDKSLSLTERYTICHLPWLNISGWVVGVTWPDGKRDRSVLLEPAGRRSEWNEGNWLMLWNSAHVSPVRDNTPQCDFLCVIFCISHVAVVCSFVTLPLLLPPPKSESCSSPSRRQGLRKMFLFPACLLVCR